MQRIYSCGCDIKWQMLSPHLCSVLEKLQPSSSLVKGQQAAQRGHNSLSPSLTRTSSSLSVPLSFTAVLLLFFLFSLWSFLLLYWTDARRAFVFRGGRTLAIKPSCRITTGAGKKGEKESGLKLILSTQWNLSHQGGWNILLCFKE